MSVMSRPFGLLRLSFALALLAPPALGGELIDRILVRVNARIVTQSLLDARVEQSSKESGQFLSGERLEELRKALVGELVNEALLEDRARDLDLYATDQEVEEQIARLKEQNGVKTDEEFATALAASGLTVDRLRDQLRKTLTVQRVVGREVNSKVDLSDDAMRVVYEREKEQYRIPERARIAEVMVTTGEDASQRAAAERRAKAAADALKEGAKFEDVVRDYSDGPTRSKAGDLGIVQKGDLAPEIDRVVFSLPQGAVSDPIQTRNGWHIVKVREAFPVSYRPFAEAKAEILKREQETQFQKKLQEYLDRLQRDAVIRVSPEAAAYYQPTKQVAPATAPPASLPPVKKS